MFLINVPVVLLALLAGTWLLPESRDPSPRRWDAPSAVLSVAGLFAVVYALKHVTDQLAMDTTGVVTGLGGLALLAVFVLRQPRVRHPLLDLSLFSHRRFSVATLCVLVCFGCYAALLFFAAQMLQLVTGHSPLHAGLAPAALALANAAGAVGAPWLARRWGHRWAITGALLAFATGFAVLAATVTTSPEPDTVAFVAALTLAGLGAGMVMTLGADTIMTTAPAHQAGQAGAIQETSFELGSGLGIAALGAILTITYRNALPSYPDLSATANTNIHESLASATELATRLQADAPHVLSTAPTRLYVRIRHSQCDRCSSTHHHRRTRGTPPPRPGKPNIVPREDGKHVCSGRTDMSIRPEHLARRRRGSDHDPFANRVRLVPLLSTARMTTPSSPTEPGGRPTAAQPVPQLRAALGVGRHAADPAARAPALGGLTAEALRCRSTRRDGNPGA